jgi:hypothetical protein
VIRNVEESKDQQVQQTVKRWRQRKQQKSHPKRPNEHQTKNPSELKKEPSMEEPTMEEDVIQTYLLDSIDSDLADPSLIDQVASATEIDLSEDEPKPDPPATRNSPEALRTKKSRGLPPLHPEMKKKSKSMPNLKNIADDSLVPSSPTDDLDRHTNRSNGQEDEVDTLLSSLFTEDQHS